MVFIAQPKDQVKNIIEDYSKKFGLKFSILRYGSIYGTRSNRFNAIYDLISQGIKKIIRKGAGNEIRNYIHVKDAAQITLNILNKRYENKYLNIIGNKKIKVKNVLDLISKKLGSIRLSIKKEQLKYHYKKNPYTYKIERGIEIKPKKSIKLSTGFDEIIKEVLLDK